MKNITKIIGIIAVTIICVSTLFYYVILEQSSDTQSVDNNELLLLQQEVRDELRANKMPQRLKQRGLILRKENFTQVSSYQKYVTPNNPTVQSYLTTNSITTSQQAYASAVSWTWVSDQVLHGKQEQWLYPAEFISDTPNDPDNPVPGDMVSDCESQAYTLVSLIEALGTSKENIRVVVGEVNFDGEIGGHAWVQMYQNGQWFELEATSGPYWDEDDLEVVESTGFPFAYFKNKPYPVVEYWAFFNDIYYYNPDNGVKSPNLPDHWLTN